MPQTKCGREEEFPKVILIKQAYISVKEEKRLHFLSAFMTKIGKLFNSIGCMLGFCFEENMQVGTKALDFKR